MPREQLIANGQFYANVDDCWNTAYTVRDTAPSGQWGAMTIPLGLTACAHFSAGSGTYVDLTTDPILLDPDNREYNFAFCLRRWQAGDRTNVFFTDDLENVVGVLDWYEGTMENWNSIPRHLNWVTFAEGATSVVLTIRVYNTGDDLWMTGIQLEGRNPWGHWPTDMDYEVPTLYPPYCDGHTSGWNWHGATDASQSYYGTTDPFPAAVPGELAATVTVAARVRASLHGEVAQQTLAATVTVGFAAEAAFGPVLEVGLLSALARIGFRGRARLNGAALPATDTIGWIAPDAAPSDLLGLSVTLGGRELKKALLEDWSIELSDRGGFESSTLTFAKDVREPPVKMLTTLLSVYKGQRLFKGRCESRTRDLAADMGTTLVFKGPLRALEDHRAFRRCFVDSDLANWSTMQPARADTKLNQFDIASDSEGIILAAQWNASYPLGTNGRAYYELFGGVPEDDCIRLIELDVEYGTVLPPGDTLEDNPFKVSLYTREHLDGPDLECLYSQVILRSGSGDVIDWPIWRRSTLSLFSEASMHARCTVVKIEAQKSTEGYNTSWIESYTHHKVKYYDQANLPLPPLASFRIKAARIFGVEPKVFTHGKAVVRPKDAIRNIVAPAFGTVRGLTSSLQLDQLDMRDIPKTRREALDDVNAMLGQDYFAWDDDVLDFQTVDGGDERVLDISDPRVTMGLSEDIDQTFNAVRVKWTNKMGKPRETVVHRDAAILGALVKADCIDAPNSVKSAKSATQVGLRYLRDHDAATMSDSVTVTGVIPGFGDALLVRPGERITLKGASGVRKKLKVTRVTLHPLEWSADIQFDVQPWRFDRYLARVAGQAHTVKR